MTETAVLDVSELLEPTEDKGAVEDLKKTRSTRKDVKATKKDAIKNWGFPGHLTKEEGDVYVQFRTEIATRGGEFQNTVYSFTHEEGEAYCLTRWLRARKYILSDVLTMVEQATECRAAPRAEGYYPEPHAALGVDPAVYLSQYPQLYSGFSKEGCPVFYSKPGRLNIDGMECTITTKGMLDYHWHVMQHDYQNRLLGFKRDNPEFRRFECVSILDLAQLTLSQLSSRTLDIIKKQSYIDSLCFPETMHKTIIVNAPKFFLASWTLIKGWLDARTVSKIEMFSSIRAAKGCLMDLIDEDQIPEDYGGTGENTVLTLEKNGQGTGGMSRMLTECMYVRSYQQKTWILEENEELDVHVYTRAVTGAKFTLTELPSRKSLVEETTVVHTGGEDGGDPLDKTLMPTTVHLTGEGGRIKGPMKLRVKGQSKGGGMFG
eukprot:CAMPEP_0198249898 /NCGR_PEP_ID=MMETSP1447-20131203/1271_1 /TAXON_ID=420782 /ORGANISM="Chaetoceros dichaeta, Strain CCMP1751" /LENGTH=431 /DNA_ID=CAMNT_0043934631 /DNA_START=128 /DNA_END=1420 /DNA_ORIENTATION=+